jgi:hypothetical protein
MIMAITSLKKLTVKNTSSSRKHQLLPNNKRKRTLPRKPQLPPLRKAKPLKEDSKLKAKTANKDLALTRPHLK